MASQASTKEEKIEAVIAMGSNLGDRRDALSRALLAIEREVGGIVKRSSVYETAPLTLPDYEGPEPSDYLNMVVSVTTLLTPQQLLATLHKIEQEVGRDRTKEPRRWMSRVIDLDIIFYGDEIVEEPNLKIPHTEMHKRDFVLQPLAEISPKKIHPQLKKSVGELYSALCL